MSVDLEVLRTNREALLLAEVAAWLHDMGKCDDRHITEESSDKKGTTGYQYKQHHNSLVSGYSVTIAGESVTLADLIERGVPGNIKEVSELWLVRALGRCHNAAHTEKEEKYLLATQKAANTRASNTFGWESAPISGLESLLKKIDFTGLTNRVKSKEQIYDSFKQALGDTRRPDNEVSLWDWGSAVATLYKAALAAALLGNKPSPEEIKWRLLSVRFDGQEALSRATKLPDLLARQKIILDGLRRVRDLLEEQYPLGTEVYCDNSGSIYVIPDIKDLLQLKNGEGKSLETLINEQFSSGTITSDPRLRQKLCLNGEIVLLITPDTTPWRAQPVRGLGHTEEPPPIESHLHEPDTCGASASSVRTWWKKHAEDICSVCRLRPQGWAAEDYDEHYRRKSQHIECLEKCLTCKGIKRKVCSICEERREDRSIEWASKKLDTTIWIDEVAGITGRLALITGSFDLTEWQNGKAVFYPESKGDQQADKLAEPSKVYQIKVFDENLTDGQKIVLSGDEYRLCLRRGLLASLQRVQNSLQPLRMNSLKVKCGNRPMLDFVISDIERRSDGSLCLKSVSPLTGCAGENECQALGITFQVADSGSALIANDPQSLNKVMKVILHDGIMVGAGFDSYRMKEALTFTRIQSIWRTFEGFWKKIEYSLSKESCVGLIAPRLRIEAEYSASAQSDSLIPSHSYEVKVENQRLSIVCVKEGEFLTAENLHYLAKQFDPEQGQKDYNTAAMFVRDVLVKKGEFEVEEPTGYGNPNKLRGKLKIKNVVPEPTPYVPAITILAEPRNFMALVPADKALNVVEAIKAKYEIEMGKVRNRLPLTVGVVFAGSRTPLAALLDAGRRMLKFKSAEKKWKVVNATDDSFKTDVDAAGNEVRTSSRRLDLESDGAIPKKIIWHFPNKMGDGSEDHWYPYFFTDTAPDGTRRMFQSPDGSRQLIHVGDLRNTDEVIVQPSTFDFEFLDSAAQRFEISYKDGKRRSRERQARPYYLEEVEDFQKIWKTLEEGLVTSQIKTLGELIETKRREWFDESALLDDDQRKQRDKTFERFVKDAITNAAWKKGKRPEVEDEDKKPTFIVQAALRGQLADVIELFTQILKQKSKVDGKDKL